MTEENKTVELKDEELGKVNGGFDVGYMDYCHRDPSAWAENPNYMGGDGRCGTCLYNPHRAWKESSCDYPNEHR